MRRTYVYTDTLAHGRTQQMYTSNYIYTCTENTSEDGASEAHHWLGLPPQRGTAAGAAH